MSQRKPTQTEVQFLQETLDSDYKNGNVRLREGEHQYILAKAIASFQLSMRFPDVKDIIRKAYGEEKADNTLLIRKIQTILKKMEKSNVVKILPKNKPWELQRYALWSFRFQDSDKNLVVLATDEEMKQAKDLLTSSLSQKDASRARMNNLRVKVSALVTIMIASYAAILWELMQPVVNPIFLVPSFSVAITSSLLLGKMLSQTEQVWSTH